MMKRLSATLLITILVTLSFTGLSKETPEEIPLRTKVIQSHEWYTGQFGLWKETLSENPSADGWLNYYAAARYAHMDEAVLSAIEKDAANAFPNSLAANLIMSWNRGFSPEAFDLLSKAIKQDPAHALAHALMALQQEYKLDANKRAEAVKGLWENNGMSASLLHYTYNVLMSVEENAYLFTEGENITLPMFLLQDVFQVRRDVRVLNLEMLLDDAYRERKLAQTGLRLNGFERGKSEVDGKRALCELLPTENPNQKFYYSLTLGQQNIAGIKDQLYVVGLASQISKERVDNITLIRENLEQRFLLDNLTVDFTGEGEFAAGKVLSANYLVPMLLLYEHYLKTGETEPMQRWDLLITKLANEKGKMLLVKNFLKLEKAKLQPFIPADLAAKVIEGHVRQIKGSLYAYESEITNADYNLFLNYLFENKLEDVYEKSKFDLSQYSEPAYSFMKNYHANTIVTKKNKYFTNYPAVNISYEGAQAYCAWLTEQYNNLPERKYKKVKFRLPTVSEWQIAALGYKKFQSWDINENIIEIAIPKNSSTAEICKGCPVKKVSFKESGILYPWFGAYNYRDKPLNSRGCALGNFKWPENQPMCKPDMPSPDGFSLMAFVEAYFPNGMGLYDVVGNVAEMTAEKGKACGGSWNHLPAESTILSINEYKGPDSATGFRPFMEVIEQ
jgi:hypothetical protein